jgi:hypothetical protein
MTYYHNINTHHPPSPHTPQTTTPRLSYSYTSPQLSSSPATAMRQPLLHSPQPIGISASVSEISMSSLQSPPQTISRRSSAAYGPSASRQPMSQPVETMDDTLDYSKIMEEKDDSLHTFTEKEKRGDFSTPFRITSWRGWTNAFTLIFLAAAILMLFGGYPIISFYSLSRASSGSGTSGYNLGGINSTGQYPVISNMPKVIDPDTPSVCLLFHLPHDDHLVCYTTCMDKNELIYRVHIRGEVLMGILGI